MRTAEWTPLDPSLRTWERSVSTTSTSPVPKEVSRDSVGATLPLSSDNTKLSGVLNPVDLRVRIPVVQGRVVEMDRTKKAAAPATSVPISQRPKKGVKIDPFTVDPSTLAAPQIQEHHTWGVREDWGDAANKKTEGGARSDWGKGASAFKKE